jgi:hypothetical protein
MPPDYVYSTRKGDDVYHVFWLCSEVSDIKKKHRQDIKPPAAENRRLCEVCADEMRRLLAIP